MAVAMHFHKVCENFADVVEGVRALWMTGNFGNLPRCQIGIDVLGQLLALFAELVNFFRNIDSRLALNVAKFFNFAFKLRHGLLKV